MGPSVARVSTPSITPTALASLDTMPALDTADGDAGVAIRNLSFQTVFQLDSILVKPSRCEVKTVISINNLFSD
ncbi:hypothetical protein Bca4012_006312 [Brassica carinata]